MKKALTRSRAKSKTPYFYEVRELDYGQRMYDPQIGRFHTLDRFAEKYESLTPYQYGANNPIKYIDVNGDSTFLMTWATANGQVGHSAIAVNNYKSEFVRDSKGNILKDKDGHAVTKQVEDGTYTVYQLVPGKAVGVTNYDSDVPAAYTVTKNVTRDQLFNTDVSTCGEDRPAEGIVGIGTDYAADQKVNFTMKVIAGVNTDYNGATNNCTDYAQSGVQAATGARINADETIPRVTFGSFTATTPNQLFKQTRTLQNATVLKNPGDLVNKKYKDGVKGR